MLEINDLLESHERERVKNMKSKILEQCQLGFIVAGNISRFMSQNATPIRPWDLYPDLFVEEREAYELEEYKQKRREYVDEMNRRRGEV